MCGFHDHFLIDLLCPTDCIDMTGQEGDYWHVSSGSDAVCGLYVIGDVDTLVELEITDFDIDCEDDGLLAVGVTSSCALRHTRSDLEQFPSFHLRRFRLM